MKKFLEALVRPKITDCISGYFLYRPAHTQQAGSIVLGGVTLGSSPRVLREDGDGFLGTGRADQRVVAVAANQDALGGLRFAAERAALRWCSRSGMTRWLLGLRMRRNNGPSVMPAAAIHSFTATIGQAVAPGALRFLTRRGGDTTRAGSPHRYSGRGASRQGSGIVTSFPTAKRRGRGRGRR
jgi:hypothetical protein